MISVDIDFHLPCMSPVLRLMGVSEAFLRLRSPIAEYVPESSPSALFINMIIDI
jgi:hypothetical protein